MAQNKNKTGRISEYLVIAFVLATTMLVLTEIGGNISNELASRRIISTPQIQPTATATLTPEDLQEILRESSPSD
ncbi:MAG: hypothetical protein H6642_04430 [Caldilineaceae bacterium]|nr:hypothetical protein [Caldilineaceae bacterium]